MDSLIPIKIWLFVIAVWFIAAFLFVAAYHPEWDLWWGSHGRFRRRKRVPISFEGRIAFGFYVGYFGVAIIVGYYVPSIFMLLLAVMVLAIFGMIIIYKRDKRRHHDLMQRQTSIDDLDVR
jgi:hypothetical protein